MGRAEALATMKEHLQSYARPDESRAYFSEVTIGTPVAGSLAEHQCFLFPAGEGELPEAYRYGTLTRAMVAERWIVKCLWQRTGSQEKREANVLEQWDAKRGIQELLRGDSKLGGNVDDLKIRRVDEQVEAFGENGVEWDVLTIEFDTWNLNAEAISA